MKFDPLVFKELRASVSLLRKSKEIKIKSANKEINKEIPQRSVPFCELRAFSRLRFRLVSLRPPHYSPRMKPFFCIWLAGVYLAKAATAAESAPQALPGNGLA